MKLTTAQQLKKGFTLVELIVVIAIIGVLAAVLIAVVDPVDKINSANDAGVISSVSQFGKANDGFAATHNNGYVGPAAAGALTVNGALAVLNTAGESKISAYTAPSGYTVSYFQSPSGTCTYTAGTGVSDCLGYAFVSSALKSKANLGYVFQVVNGKSCKVLLANAATQTTLNNSTAACP